MLQSKLFTKTTKTIPSDETSKNAQLLLKAGYIHKDMAGVYSFLPLGLQVLTNIINIIRQELNEIGCQEVFLASLQNPELRKKTNRRDNTIVDNRFKTSLKNKTELGLGFTHEEPLTNLLTNYIHSYKDLPFCAYQFQTKFRNETRAKSGIMRTREFIMKDAYSFHTTKPCFDVFYAQMQAVYTTIFRKLGIGEQTYMTFASGGVFSEFSHEFQTICDAGEDIIYVDEEKHIAINKEVYTDDVIKKLGCKKETLVEKKAIEVGNIFELGTKFSEPLGLFVTSEQNEKIPVLMGCYGIGPARVMGTIVELRNDAKGIVRPESIAPYTYHLLSLGADEQARTLYNQRTKEGKRVLFDDRSVSAGEKLHDADLLGMPYRVVVSQKTITQGKIEIMERKTGKIYMQDIV